MRDDDSPAGSGPPSPTSSRRFSNTRKYRGFLLPSASDLETIQDDRRDDEDTPLLKSKSSSGLAASGYKRASDGTLTPKPRLSRHASSSGTTLTLRGRRMLSSLTWVITKTSQAAYDTTPAKTPGAPVSSPPYAPTPSRSTTTTASFRAPNASPSPAAPQVTTEYGTTNSHPRTGCMIILQTHTDLKS